MNPETPKEISPEVRKANEQAEIEQWIKKLYIQATEKAVLYGNRAPRQRQRSAAAAAAARRRTAKKKAEKQARKRSRR